MFEKVTYNLYNMKTREVGRESCTDIGSVYKQPLSVFYPSKMTLELIIHIVAFVKLVPLGK